MTSLGENTSSEIATENHNPFDEHFESNFPVDESEAKDINSCLNFLSILDEESSDDSCEYTLFRKKDEIPSTGYKIEESKTNPISSSLKKTDEDDSDSNKYSLKKNESLDEATYGEGKEKDSLESKEKIKEVVIINEEQINSQEENLEINKSCQVTCSSPKLGYIPKVNKSPDFKIISRTGPKIFKISPISQSTISKKETTSIIRSANNIVLKVPSLPSKMSSLSPKESSQSHSLPIPKNILREKILVKITTKHSKIKQNASVIQNPDMVKKTPSYYSKNNSITPQTNRDETNSKKIKAVINNKYNESKISISNSPKRSKNFQCPSKGIVKKTKKETLSENGQVNIDAPFSVQEKHPKLNDYSCDNKRNIQSVCPNDDGQEISLSKNIKAADVNLIHNKKDIDNNLKLKEDADALLASSPDTICPANKKKESNLNPEVRNKRFKPKNLSRKRIVKTRLLEGKKNGIRRNREINLLNRTPFPEKILDKSPKPATVSQPEKDSGQANKYIPLTRTELPTFLKKFDSSEHSIPIEDWLLCSDLDGKDYNFSETNSTSKEEADCDPRKGKYASVESFNESDLLICNTEEKREDVPKAPANEEEKFSHDPIKEKDNLLEKVREKVTEGIKENKFLVGETGDQLENIANAHIPSDEVSQLSSFTRADVENSDISDDHSISTPLYITGDDDFKPEVQRVLLEATETSLNAEPCSSKNCESDNTNSEVNQSDKTCVSLYQEEVVSVSLYQEEVPYSLTQNSELTEVNGEKGTLPKTVNVENMENACRGKMPDDILGHIQELKLPVIAYCYNKSSSLSFSVQNILENMFKHESFPSSTNMARLAKLMKVQWKDVRDWFVARRHLNKKNGILSRDQPLTSCPYCPDYANPSCDKAIIHLLNREHIQRMTSFMEKDNLIFSKFQHEIDEKKQENEISKDPFPEGECLPALRQSTSSSSSSIKGPSSATSIKTDVSKASPKPKFAIPKPVPMKRPKDPLSKNKSSYFPLPQPLRQSLNKESAYQDFKGSETTISTTPDLHDRTNDFRTFSRIDAKIFVGYRCPICAKIFQSEWMLIRHSISHRKLICSECDEVFLREDLLQHHFKEHIVESMEAEMYSMFLCFKCYKLNCICAHDTQYVPSVRTKHFLRPQMARRSKPFLSNPYSGVNEHLKVTMNEFWHEYKSGESKPFRNKESALTNLHLKLPKKEKKPKVLAPESNTKPTYTNMTTFNCDICESFFFTEDELKEHIIVHRIQARNRSKKRQEKEELEKKSKEPEFLKPSSPMKPLYFCSYCNKGYRKERSLSNHFRSECKQLPTNIVKQLSSSKIFETEKTGKGNNHYKIKLKRPLSSDQPSEVKCKFCSVLFPEVSKLSEHNCSSNPAQSLSSVEKENKKYYLLCKYCSIPLSTEEQLNLHIIENCHSVPDAVKAQLYSNSVSQAEWLGKGIDHYKKVERSNVVTFLSAKVIRSFFDISTFPSLKSNYKRVKCKFCSRDSLKSCLKLHLLKQCRGLPEELREFLLRNKNYLSEKFKVKPLKKKPKLVQSSKTLPTSSSQATELNETDESKTDVDETKNTTQPLNDVDPYMLYDCHLCEEKFKLSKDFISHMSNFHCMNISEDSSSKWLSSVNNKIDSNEGLSPLKTPEKMQSNDNIFEQDVNLENIAETMLVSDYTKLKEREGPKQTPSPRNKRKSVVSSMSESPGKSQKMDEGELLGDLSNLDSFIETVQLEDSTFKDASL